MTLASQVRNFIYIYVLFRIYFPALKIILEAEYIFILEETMSEYTVVFIRSTFSFFFIFLLTRILGKKQISQLTFFDYVVGLVIGNIASSMPVDTSIQILNGIIALVVYTIFPLLITLFALKSFKFRELSEGSPTILIRDGQILENNLAKSRMTFDDL